jgi:hypothetical protein
MVAVQFLGIAPRTKPVAQTGDERIGADAKHTAQLRIFFSAKEQVRIRDYHAALGIAGSQIAGKEQLIELCSSTTCSLLERWPRG